MNKKIGKEKWEWISKHRDQNSCLSDQSTLAKICKEFFVRCSRTYIRNKRIVFTMGKMIWCSQNAKKCIIFLFFFQFCNSNIRLICIALLWLISVIKFFASFLDCYSNHGTRDKFCTFSIWGGFQNNTLREILLLYIFWLQNWLHKKFSNLPKIISHFILDT